MVHPGFLQFPKIAAQIDFIDAFINMLFGAMGLFFFLFIAIFVGVFLFAFYMICKTMRSAAQVMDTPRSVPATPEPRHERQLLRESLPVECPQCDAPLKYNEVRWTGPRQAECPYCGNVVELEETIVRDD